MLVPTIGWSIAVLLIVPGALLLAFRHGRGTLILGSLVSVATTAMAQYGFHFGSGHPAQWWLYWGGFAVLAVAALPAIGRWIAKPTPTAPGFPATAAYRPH